MYENEWTLYVDVDDDIEDDEGAHQLFFGFVGRLYSCFFRPFNILDSQMMFCVNDCRFDQIENGFLVNFEWRISDRFRLGKVQYERNSMRKVVTVATEQPP